MKSRSPSKISQCYLPEDKLKIIIRIRPILNEQDSDQFVKLQDDNTIQIRRPGNHSYMKFNNILPMNSSQKDVFFLVQDSIKQFLNGINITIFAYGQTGAGKTYSMIGNYSPHDSRENLFNFLSSKQRGILSRSLERIMMALHQSKNNMKIYVSFFEIYNQKIFDLYTNTLIPLDIRQSKNGQISIPDLSSFVVTNMEDAIQYLMIGLKNRSTGSTHAHAKSSRSHSIFQISLQKQNENGETINSSLRIVDLAGSQKFKIPSDISPSEKEIRIQELTNINGSLSCLGHCISALIEKSRTHIPFRNSKLTRILSDSLLGKGKMRFIICISPSMQASAETFSTLQFANRAKKAIFERGQMRSPHLSKKKSSENDEILSLRKELERQKQQRAVLEKELTGGIHDKFQMVLKENALLRKENQKLRHEMLEHKGNNKNKSPRQKSRNISQMYQFQQSKQDFKEQMLKLPIFQNMKFQKETEKQNKNIKLNVNHNINHNHSNKNTKDKNSISLNKKKADFQKKVKKFIQADSPTQSNPKFGGIMKPNHNYSFQPEDSFNKVKRMPTYPEQEDEDSFQRNEECDDWADNDDTQQIIEKACQKMNIPDFKDLKNEMERAKNELMLLKKKDDELSSKKAVF